MGYVSFRNAFSYQFDLRGKMLLSCNFFDSAIYLVEHDNNSYSAGFKNIEVKKLKVSLSFEGDVKEIAALLNEVAERLEKQELDSVNQKLQTLQKLNAKQAMIRSKLTASQFQENQCCQKNESDC